jgi:hypothetical protein
MAPHQAHRRAAHGGRPFYLDRAAGRGAVLFWRGGWYHDRQGGPAIL